jgi:hypothetical protein
MSALHRYVGYFIVGVFAAGWLWGLGAKLLKRGPGESFWRWLTVAQVTAGVQAVVGIVLLVTGRRVDWLHYAYGLFPIAALAVAHVLARGMERDQWVPFAWASFFSFGLTLRALMTGLGFGS